MPVLKSMYLSAFNNTDAYFYGFANGDILFDNGLKNTLTKIKEVRNVIGSSLLFGIRRNYNMVAAVKNGSLPVLWKVDDVNQLGNNKYSTLFIEASADYFIVTGDFPFNLFKPVVTSRLAFDTYFSAFAQKRNVTTIDGTHAITALHQTDNKGNFESQHRPIKKEDFNYNVGMIGHSFDHSKGYAKNAIYQAQLNEMTGNVILRCKNNCKQKIKVL